MKVYTSYFDNAGYLKEQGFACVGISLYPPEKFKDNNLYIIAPSADLLAKIKSGEYTKEQYRFAYLLQLKNTDISSIIEAIINTSKNNDDKDVVLCCYEGPNEFCHRHIFAEWLNSFGYFGGDVHEWTAKDKKINSVELF